MNDDCVKEVWVYEEASKHFSLSSDARFITVLAGSTAFLKDDRIFETFCSPNPCDLLAMSTIILSPQWLSKSCSLVSEASDLPFEPESLDQIIFAFWPLDEASLDRFIEQASLVLKPGGELTIFNFNRYRRAAKKIAQQQGCPDLPSFLATKSFLYAHDFDLQAQRFYCITQQFPKINILLQHYLPGLGLMYQLQAVKKVPKFLVEPDFSLLLCMPQNSVSG